ncbi:MAG: histidine triad nucleotide-binding protein [Anaerolineae bacterium]|nr:histidine triad nucleotide-binding protein [Anaerolineae bacterium]
MTEDCIFCKIVAGKVGGPPLYQDDEMTAFKDINPQSPTHILIVTNQHLASLNEATEADQAVLGRLLLLAAKLAKDEGIAEQGYRLVINNGREAGQEVFHLHLHLMGGRKMRLMG